MNQFDFSKRKKYGASTFDVRDAWRPSEIVLVSVLRKRIEVVRNRRKSWPISWFGHLIEHNFRLRRSKRFLVRFENACFVLFQVFLKL